MSDNEKLVGVTKEVIDQFLHSLENDQVDADIVERLRVTILDQGKTTDKALREAMFQGD